MRRPANLGLNALIRRPPQVGVSGLGYVVDSPTGLPAPGPNGLGPSLGRGAAAIFDDRRDVPLNHFGWLYPGANSRHVREFGSIFTPAYDAVNRTEVFSYQVPQGLRFSLRAVLVDGRAVTNWDEGSDDMVFTLAVVKTAGARNVDGFNHVTTHLGSLDNGPWVIDGRLEFAPLDTLTWFVETFATVGVGAPNRVICGLIGHLYPNIETV